MRNVFLVPALLILLLVGCKSIDLNNEVKSNVVEDSVLVKIGNIIINDGGLIEPKEGWLFVHIKTVFVNKGKDSTVVSFDKFKIEDSEGRRFSYKDFLEGTTYSQNSLSLEPTQNSTETISFEIPKSSLENPLKLIYENKKIGILKRK